MILQDIVADSFVVNVYFYTIIYIYIYGQLINEHFGQQYKGSFCLFSLKMSVQVL